MLGLWHLGCVTAACLAEQGFDVVGVDPDQLVVAELRRDRPPVAEPGLAELIREGRKSKRLTFANLDEQALGEVDVVWIAFDTPVDDQDRADAGWVTGRARLALNHAAREALVVVSSQLPVGSTARLAAQLAADGRDELRFACVPENLRLGQALSSFRAPDRLVAGVRDVSDCDLFSPLLTPFADRIEWMGVESAEMTKHALNGFLATSIAFINEVAALCESVGADASEVSRALKSDLRIGPRSYLDPGNVVAGGTLARDVDALHQVAHEHGLPAHLIEGVAASNASHREWPRRMLTTLLGGDEPGATDSFLKDTQVAVWGLTYKPGTDTLRRSSALELCRWLRERDATVRAHDPAISVLPAGEADGVDLCGTPLEAARGADALVLCTAWPEYREVDSEQLLAALGRPIVIDATGHLDAVLAHNPAVRYARVGTRPA